METLAISVGSDNECDVNLQINSRWELAFGGLWRMERDKIIARFWKSVDRSGECWTCRLSSGDYYGHAQFTFRDHQKQHHISAHRFSWFLEHGATELCVLHECDNPPCVRPSHLFLGTQSDNMKDAARKRRLSGPRVHLSANARREILAAPSGSEACERIAQKFGCTEETVFRLRARLRRHSFLLKSAYQSTPVTNSQIA